MLQISPSHWFSHTYLMPLLFINSPLLPIPHGFSTRRGGVSSGPYQSLNLGFSVGDSRENVLENLARVAAAVGVSVATLTTASQVHGNRVLEVSSPVGDPPPLTPLPPRGEADALWTSDSQLAVAVKTADCVPVLLADPTHRRVAAVHSGWRGTEAEVVRCTVEALLQKGSRADQLVAAIGPSIGACCYAVSPELAARFSRKFGTDVIRTAEGKPHLNLARAIQRTLLEVGLRPEHIDLLPQCTSCNPEEFFSHRRDRGVTGRHLSYAVCQF